MTSVRDLHRALVDPRLPAVLDELGFRPDDARDAAALAQDVAASEADLGLVAELAERLGSELGQFGPDRPDPWDHPAARTDRYGVGVLPMLTMIATVDRVRAYHRSRGVPSEISRRSLSDLGQQTWLHRRAFDAFGLHTYGWMRLAWTGNLYWLGRLQFNLAQQDGAWMLGTHIPRTGPLDPETVDASLAHARVFFPDHFPDHPVSTFTCFSWLLDPEITRALDPGTNIARFGRRWQLHPPPTPSDDDTIYFTFGRRQVVDLDELPQDTTLERAIVARLRSGGHWHTWRGTMPFSAPTDQVVG